MRRFVTAVLVCACAASYAWAQAPERKASGNVITSAKDPKVQITLPKDVKYVGADRWVLYGVADCELHAWVEVDADNMVQKLYWVQFEGYIPSRPDAVYEYDSKRHVNLGGLDFFLDTWANRETENKWREGSDRERIEKMIRAKHAMPSQMVYARLVHLPTPDKRKELMIIYGERLSDDVNALDVDENPAKKDQWAPIDKKLVEGAKAAIKIKQ
jgi:hypothetical protein